MHPQVIHRLSTGNTSYTCAYNLYTYRQPGRQRLRKGRQRLARIHLSTYYTPWPTWYTPHAHHLCAHHICIPHGITHTTHSLDTLNVIPHTGAPPPRGGRTTDPGVRLRGEKTCHIHRGSRPKNFGGWNFQMVEGCCPTDTTGLG